MQLQNRRSMWRLPNAGKRNNTKNKRSNTRTRIQRHTLRISGRGYHLRIQDEELLQTTSNYRTELVNYCIGAEVPELTGELQHFIIPFGYSKVYTDWFKYTVNNLDKNKRYSGLNKKLKNDIIKRKELVNSGQWGLVRGEIKPVRYDKLTRMIAGINRELCDTKVSIS